MALAFRLKRFCLARCPMALVELEKPNGVKRVVGHSTEPVHELAATHQALVTLHSGFEKLRIQASEPLGRNAGAGAEDLLVVVEVKTADHPLDRSVMYVGVPAN